MKAGNNVEVSRDLAEFTQQWKQRIKKDARIAQYLMTTKWAVQLLQTPDEDAYQNTPVHLACALQSYLILKIFLAKLDPIEREKALKYRSKEGVTVCSNHPTTWDVDHPREAIPQSTEGLTPLDVIDKEIKKVNGCLNEEYRDC